MQEAKKINIPDYTVYYVAFIRYKGSADWIWYGFSDDKDVVCQLVKKSDADEDEIISCKLPF